MRIVTKVALLAGVGYGLYLVSCNHFIYFGARDIELLKKEKPTFSRTFYSATLKKPETIIADDVLRKAGIAELLVERGMLSEERKDFLLKKILEEQEED